MYISAQMFKMPKKMKNNKVSIRLDLEGKDFKEFQYVSDYYGISIAKELTAFLIKKEYRKIKEDERKILK